MAGHGGADGDLGGLEVADFADHDDVRILAQDGAQAVGEGEADLGFHIDLRYAGKPVFHRFFDRDDAAGDGVDGSEKAVKAGRFSRAGRAGGEDDSVRVLEQRLHGFHLLLAHVEPLDAEGERLAAREQAQGDRFAIHGGDRRDAHVDEAGLRLQIDAAILRQAALGDVHVRHHFQARNDRALQHAELRRHGDLVQDAVDAVSDAQVVFERLDVDVGGALDDGFADDLVDELDDARLGVVARDVLRELIVLVVVGARGLENFLERFRADAVERLDGAHELAARDDVPLELAAAELLLREPARHGIEDVEGRELDRGVARGERQDLVLEDEAARQQLQHAALDARGFEIVERRLEELRQFRGELVFIDLAGVQHLGRPRLAGGRLDRRELRGVFVRDARGAEDVDEDFARGHCEADSVVRVVTVCVSRKTDFFATGIARLIGMFGSASVRLRPVVG